MPDDSSEVLLDLQKSIDGLPGAPSLTAEDIKKLRSLAEQADKIVEDWNKYLANATKDAPSLVVESQTAQSATAPAINIDNEASRLIEEAYMS